MNTTPNPMEPMSHPTEETLAAFIDARLDPSARRIVIEHIAICAECRDIVTAGMEFQMSENATTNTGGSLLHFSPRAMFRAAAVLAAAAVLVLVFGPMLKERAEERERMSSLVTAVGFLQNRPVKGRLYANFGYQPYHLMRGNGGDSPSGKDWVEETAQQIVAVDGRHPDAEAQHRAGVALLVSRHADRAVTALEAALRQEVHSGGDIPALVRQSKDPSLLNDLAIAYLARRGGTNDSRNALTAAEQSWQLKKTPQAAWNRALAHEDLNETDAAIQAWRDYLALDSSSEWAAEANTYLKELLPPEESPQTSVPATK